MTDYIRRDIVLQIINTVNDTGGFAGYADYCTLFDEIDTMPAADAQPVKHGYWEEVTDYGGWGDTHYRCSVCGEEWYLEDGKPKDNNMNFCPRCGARMDAEPDEPWQSE